MLFTFFLGLLLSSCLLLFLGKAWKKVGMMLDALMSSFCYLVQFLTSLYNQPVEKQGFEHIKQGCLLHQVSHHCSAQLSADLHSIISQTEHVSAIIGNVIDQLERVFIIPHKMLARLPFYSMTLEQHKRSPIFLLLAYTTSQELGNPFKVLQILWAN